MNEFEEISSGDNLTEQERAALQATSEALEVIRQLAQTHITANSQRMIFDLADAFHNIPAYAAGSKAQRIHTSFLLDAGIRDAQEVHQRYGLASRFLPALEQQANTAMDADFKEDNSNLASADEFMAKYGNLPGRLVNAVFKKKDK